MSNERKAVVGHEVDAASGVITFSVLGAGQFQFDPNACTEEVREAAMLHGFVQKLSDKAAIQRDAKTGRSATPKEKHDRMWELAEHLMGGGAWVMRVASAARLNRACLFAAIAGVRNVAPEKVAAKFQGYEDKVLQTFLTHKDIAAEYSRLTAPADSSAADAMLETLEAE